ncbi:MAG: hypothetical protein H0X38_04795 [Planctomycetes bacterium]|nr:hypothetical protein [Planctomycetota bacterium]
MHLTRSMSALLALLLGASLASSAVQAADAAPPSPASAAAQNPTPPTVDTAAAANDLLKSLPQVPSLTVQGGKVVWADGDKPGYVVSEISRDGNPLIETPIGRLPVSLKLVADNRLDAIAGLPALIAQAQVANLKSDGFELKEGVLTGIHLRSPGTIVIGEGVMKKVDNQAPDRSADKAKVASAVDGLLADLAKTDLDDLGKKTLEDVLKRLPQDDDPKMDVDEVAPSFARRVVRGGWLRQFYKNEQDTIVGFERLVASAEHYEPVTLFEGTGLRLAEVKDAFGRSGWFLTTPTRSSYIQIHEEPLYYWVHPDPKPMIVVDLPGGTDPTAVPDSAAPFAARIYQGAQLLASWTKDKGFTASKDDWRRAFPAGHHKGVDPNAAADFMPPHLLVTALNGDLVSLLTPHGVLVPPKNGSPEEVERFLADAARTLPDPANLDLIGEYIFAYVYDSPDSRYPFLIGNKGVKGDIHQTAAQTISTACGGMIRGDCDDLSELYEVIANRQGRSAQVIALPQHAAMCFAEKKEDGNWHTFVLQTGPPLEFIAPKLPASLEKAYRSFDESETFDPDGLSLLLRFSGENTRGSWRLSWRIFAEPDYAKTMIDVQRDWQYQTYQRGIAKMKKLIEGGDQDNANFRELSGLYSFTGQYALAVQHQQEAITRTEDAGSRLSLSVELVMHQFDAHQTDEARKSALDILDRQLPALRKSPETREKTEATLPQVGLELAGALIHGKAYDLALRTLKETMLESMATNIEQVGQWLASPNFNQKAWDNSSQLLALRHLMAAYSGTAVLLLDGLGTDALTKDANLQVVARSVQDWLSKVAFHDTDEPEDALQRYAVAGRYYAAVLGEDRLSALLDGVALPKSAEYAHAKRIGGLAQLQLDLPWIKLAPPFWSMRLMELFEKEKTTIDRPLALRLAKQEAESYAAAAKLGLESPMFDHAHHISTLINALLTQDAKVVRERLAFVKQKDDKRLRDDTAQWLGDAARFLPLDWYAKVLGIWKEEVDYKPKYYWIAWRAALTGAPRHALMVAELAAKQFKDDPSFTEEFVFMKKVLEKAAAEAKPVEAKPADAAKPESAVK